MAIHPKVIDISLKTTIVILLVALEGKPQAPSNGDHECLYKIQMQFAQ